MKQVRVLIVMQVVCGCLLAVSGGFSSATLARAKTARQASAVVALPVSKSVWRLPPRAPDRVIRLPAPAIRRAVHAADRTRWRVGLQVGHWRVDEVPEELAKLRGATGTYYQNIEEVDLNLAIAQRVQVLLEAEGLSVDLLPAHVPPGYAADAVIAIHADGAPAEIAHRRGWKLAVPWRASPAARQLLAAVSQSYSATTGLPEDLAGQTFDMSGYYAFNSLRFTHTVAPTTPALILELGFLTNSADRLILLEQPDLVAHGIADGLLTYLRRAAPADRQPVTYPALTPAQPQAVLRTQPWQSAAQLAVLSPGQALLPLDHHGDWWLVVPAGDWSLLGWIEDKEIACGRCAER